MKIMSFAIVGLFVLSSGERRAKALDQALAGTIIASPTPALAPARKGYASKRISGMPGYESGFGYGWNMVQTPARFLIHSGTYGVGEILGLIVGAILAPFAFLAGLATKIGKVHGPVPHYFGGF